MERVVQERGLVGYRIAAKLIDLALLTFFEIVVFFSFFKAEGTGPPGSAQVALGRILGLWPVWLGFGVVDAIYFFGFEYFSQATLGKRVFGLKVIDYIKGRPGARQILGRSIISSIAARTVLWPVELLAMLLDKREMRIADHAAGTKVIRVRTVASTPAPAADRKV